MKRTITALLAVIAVAIALHRVNANPDPEKVITGEAACAKCILKEADTCALTLTTEDAGKKVTYTVANNDVAKEFGHQVCKAKKKVTAIGTVKTVNGKSELTPSKITLVKS